jgi:chemotaxis protein MotB
VSDTTPHAQEIIIVRRNNGDGDGGHHGGAWKIAYADFVTAMMAFFLVMWLVNSANEVTKSRVASYFNPIKMTDPVASTRGLKDPTEKNRITSSEGEKPADVAESEAKEAKEAAVAEENLMKEPFLSMEKIVLEAAKSKSNQEDIAPSRETGDPFDPKAWETLRGSQLPQDGTAEVKTGESVQPAQTVEIKEKPSDDTKQDEGVRELKATLDELVNKHKAELDISIDVRRTEEGLLIELGDKSGQGMFAIGSAEPTAGLIDIVGVIGRLLSQQSGNVVVRGHTDARQFKKGRRDNWQLSTARAHMASYMLLRGGLNEFRVKRIEGHGSASPFLTSDPLADSNRRVEFLLQSPDDKP